MITRSKSDPPPPEGLPAWLDANCRDLLRAIRDPERAKKRRTVIELAFAIANQKPLTEVWARPDTCGANTWYGDNRTLHSGQRKPGWQDLPDVAAAFAACKERALDFADDETASLEAHYTRQRRQAIGKYAAQAPMSLAAVMASTNQRGSDRINAALALIKLADPETRDVNTPAGAAETTGPIVILPDNGRDRDPQEAGHRNQAPDPGPLTPDP
jgi:hypothetical protein